MPRLPKAIIQKYGITKKAWNVYRGGGHSSVGKTRMAKRKRSYGRFRRARRRFSKAKVPFEVLLGAASIPFTKAKDRWDTPFDRLQAGDMNGLMMHLKSGFLGIEPTGAINVMSALNPFDMENARYTKILIYAALIGAIRRKITGKYTAPLFKKIPLIGRFIN